MKKHNIIIPITIMAFLLCPLNFEKETHAKSNNINSPATTYKDKINNKEVMYTNLEGLSGKALQEGLATVLTENHKYYTSYDDTRGAIAFSDEDPNDDTKVIAFYGGIGVSNYWQPNNYASPDAWNREHVWCKSLSGGLFNEVTGSDRNAGTDIHQLRPAVNVLNSSRNNSKYANLNKTGNELIYNHSTGPIKTGNYSANDLFEPRDDIKGDIARMLMYMYTHYSNELDNSTLNFRGNLKIENIVEDTDAWKLLLNWNRLDPVDEFEMNRNNYCLSITGVSNPYVDHPEFAYMAFDTSYTGDGALIDNRYNKTIEIEEKDIVLDINDNYQLDVIGDNLSFISCNNNILKLNGNTLIPLKEGKTVVLISDGYSSTSMKVKIVDSSKKYTINFYNNDKTNTVYASYVANYGELVDFPLEKPIRDGYTFKFWSACNLMYAEEFDNTTIIEDNINLYATWASDSTTNNNFVLVDDVSDLEDGDKIIIACKSKNKVAGDFFSSGSYLTAVDASFTDNMVTSELAEIFTLNKKNDAFTFTSSDGVKIATNAAKAFNKNGVDTWTITFKNTNAIITSTNENYGSIQYNASSPRFLNYTSGQTAISLYKLEEKTIDYKLDVSTKISLGFRAIINQDNNIISYDNPFLRFSYENNNDDYDAVISYAYTDIAHESLLNLGDFDNDYVITGMGNCKIDNINQFSNVIAVIYYATIEDKTFYSEIIYISYVDIINYYLENEDVLVAAKFSKEMIEQIYNVLENLL